MTKTKYAILSEVLSSTANHYDNGNVPWRRAAGIKRPLGLQGRDEAGPDFDASKAACCTPWPGGCLRPRARNPPGPCFSHLFSEPPAPIRLSRLGVKMQGPFWGQDEPL